VPGIGKQPQRIIIETDAELNEDKQNIQRNANYKRFIELSKQRKSMEETVNLYYEWKKATESIKETQEMIWAEDDDEMKSFLKAELELKKLTGNLSVN
jgi:peptide chain release factor 1